MRIIKRKKGNKEYHYLQHSFRSDGKVITKERYLGGKIPEDIEKIKENFKKELQNKLYKRLESIKKSFQKEWKKIPPSVRKKELEEISIAFTYNTNAIEGSTITLEEAREIIHDKISPNKPLRDVRETEAHSEVFLKMLEKKEKLSKDLILKWHEEIFGMTKSDIAGKYRNYLVTVGGYLPPDSEKINKLMNNLIDFINSSKLNPVELAGRSHFIFESIHPFGDGNGRIGRLLMNYILWHSGYPMLIIEYKKRSSYYKAFNKKEDGFAKYFIRRYLAVHKRGLEKSNSCFCY
jgi:Fic family protein